MNKNTAASLSIRSSNISDSILSAVLLRAVLKFIIGNCFFVLQLQDIQHMFVSCLTQYMRLYDLFQSVLLMSLVTQFSWKHFVLKPLCNSCISSYNLKTFSPFSLIRLWLKYFNLTSSISIYTSDVSHDSIILNAPRTKTSIRLYFFLQPQNIQPVLLQYVSDSIYAAVWPENPDRLAFQPVLLTSLT